MAWKVISTKTFLKEFRKYKKNSEFIGALEKKMQRLKENPNNVGGFLSHRLHGYKSTRIIKKLRLVFRIDKNANSVFLIGIDHRKFGYENF